MEEYRSCFLCGRNGSRDRLERHHIFGGPNRDLSEQYGLVVDLCGEQCHRNGPKAAHRSAETMKLLRIYGQKKAMRENGWTAEQFREVFGKNYLEGEDT
jgi:hypothetical protein